MLEPQEMVKQSSGSQSLSYLSVRSNHAVFRQSSFKGYASSYSIVVIQSSGNVQAIALIAVIRQQSSKQWKLQSFPPIQGHFANQFYTHWSKLTLILFLILRTFDHSSRWEMIKEFQILAKNGIWVRGFCINAIFMVNCVLVTFHMLSLIMY